MRGPGVESALLGLGNGFLEHPDNGALRGRLHRGELALTDYFGQLLRLVYRLIFLLAAEDRDLLHPPGTSLAARKLYRQRYSLAALRENAVRRAAWDRRHDRWEGLGITFVALAFGEGRLGLPALGGLFTPGTLADLENARLANRRLMEAIYRLAWLEDDSGLVPVNWRDMETEELGSVYESLLELTPQLDRDGRHFKFAEGGEAQGHARKTSGSYYTPDGLVQALLDSALDPVLDRFEAQADDPALGLLSVTVLDPACGSGHFLLAAARRIATRLARARTNGPAFPADYRHALRDVARACIYGVDRNPMAVELTKVALWIETVDPGKPLGFLDANIRVGDSLLGVFDLKVLADGIPDAAYKPLSGDDRKTAKHFAKRNKAERFEAMHDDWRRSNLRMAADLYIAAFLTPKTGGVPNSPEAVTVPTTAHVRDALAGLPVHAPLVGRAQDLAREARSFHWPLEFPEMMAAGGFAVVLGNPPWERIKLQEQEFFAARDREIVQAPNAAARGKLIAKLKKAAPGTSERALHDQFAAAKRTAEAASVFARLQSEDGGRFPLTGRGDVNTYALFAELFASVASKHGRAGMIVPAGLTTDYNSSFFFRTLVSEGRLVRSLGFDNQRRIFSAVHPDTPFTLLTMGRSDDLPEFASYLLERHHLDEPDRRYRLSADDIARINPNTRTAPVFRSRADAELTAKIHARAPVLIDRTKGQDGNPWKLSFTTMFHMSNDSGVFRTASQLAEAGFVRDGCDWIGPRRTPARYVPLYEAKMIHQFDHHWATYENGDSRDATSSEKSDAWFEPGPRYWVPEQEAANRLAAKGWTRAWLMGWRNITNSTNERSLIAAVFPRAAAGHSLPLCLPGVHGALAACLLANLSSLVTDYCERQKLSGTNLTFEYLFQLPFLPPGFYTPTDIAFIVERVLELTYTSRSMAPFARDLDYDGPPFGWDETRRAQLRAELDAWYAHAYGLDRDELRYILDPADVKGAGYPSETFRVLKSIEIRRFGEYRTARLVLAAYDAILASGNGSANLGKVGCGGQI